MTREELQDIVAELQAPFRQAILDAAAKKGKKLHQLIVGPLSSGKTTAAHDYAAALAEAGLASGQVVEIHYHEQLDYDAAEERFKKAKGGVIVIDDITRHVDDASLPHPVTGFMWRALAGTETTVILTGYKDRMEEFASTAQPDQRPLLPEPVEMEKSYSFDERQAFRNPGEAARQKRAARRNIAAEWKDAQASPALAKPVRAPKTARFKNPAQEK